MTNIKVGTKLKMIDGGGTYIVTRIDGENVELENVKFVSGIDCLVDDIPLMFDVPENYKR